MEGDQASSSQRSDGSYAPLDHELSPQHGTAKEQDTPAKGNEPVPLSSPTDDAHTANDDCDDIIILQPNQTPVLARVMQPSNENYFLLSIALSVLCLCCGTWLSLLCSVPAIFFANAAQSAEKLGDGERAQRNARIALILMLAAVVCWAVVVMTVIITSITTHHSHY